MEQALIIAGLLVVENIIPSVSNFLQSDPADVFVGWNVPDQEEPIQDPPKPAVQTAEDPLTMQRRDARAIFENAQGEVQAHQYHIAEMQDVREGRAKPTATELEAWGLISVTQWHHKLLIEMGEATRELMEAEKRLSDAARCGILHQALNGNSSRSSKFVDEPADDIGLEKEVAAAIAGLDHNRIETWRASIPTDVESDTGMSGAPTDDDARAVSLVDFGESWSTYAAGRAEFRIMRWDAKRTARWQEIYGRGSRGLKNRLVRYEQPMQT